MIIGLEYEGVIKKGNKIVCWHELDESTKTRIKAGLQSRLNLDPVDNYDCLAEVRDIKLTNPTSRDLL